MSSLEAEVTKQASAGERKRWANILRLFCRGTYRGRDTGRRGDAFQDLCVIPNEHAVRGQKTDTFDCPHQTSRYDSSRLQCLQMPQETLRKRALNEAGA